VVCIDLQIAHFAACNASPALHWEKDDQGFDKASAKPLQVQDI
jgi:hypothetical protein